MDHKFIGNYFQASDKTTETADEAGNNNVAKEHILQNTQPSIQPPIQ